jgi:hypothetical protein
MPYLPPNQYETKFTNGGELYNPINGNEYTGYYIKYRNKFFAGNSPQNLKIKLRKIELSTENQVSNPTNFLYNQLNKKFYQKIKNRKIPYPSKPLPTEEDYTKGIFTRYFCQRANNKLYIIELDKEVYNGLLSGTYDKVLYTPGKINWSLQNSQLNNDNVLKLEKKFPQLRIFFNNPEEFVKAPPGFHYMPDGTLMEGDSHPDPLPPQTPPETTNNSTSTSSGGSY